MSETPTERGLALARLAAGGVAWEALADAIATDITAAVAEERHECEMALHRLEAAGPLGDGGNDDWQRGWHTGLAAAIEVFLARSDKT